MSRDPYYQSPQRWDAERFTFERDRNRFSERDRFEERDTRMSGGRREERTVDDVYERRGPRGYEEERFRERDTYEEPAREPPRRERGQSITIEREREREYLSPSPPRRAPARPGFLRRQSSLDTFDRKPLGRYSEEERYGPPARIYRQKQYIPEPLPVRRALPPPRIYAEREYEEIKVAEPDFFDEPYRRPERVREREIIRTRRRSESREAKESVKEESVRSASVSSSSSEETVVSKKSEFPKRGKTRMPGRLVNKDAITALGYDYETEGDVVIIQKALGRENIDEVIKLSEDFSRAEVSGGRSRAGDIIEERIAEEVVLRHPARSEYAESIHEDEIIQKTTLIERREVSPARTARSTRSRSVGPQIVTAIPPEFYEPPGTLVVMNSDRTRGKDERAIRAEIKALEAEKEALRAEKKASKELRRAERIRREGRESSEMTLYERDDVTERSRSRSRSRSRRRKSEVVVEKDKKVPDPRALRFMLKTLT